MDTVKIKQEPIDIKEEPLDSDYDVYENHQELDQALLVPKIEVIETAILVSNMPVQVAESSNNLKDSLSCPKCHIRYYSAMSIKNHIQVCKRDMQNSDGTIAPIERLWKAKPKIVIKGVKKLPDDERRSIRILEQSCFVNELSTDEGPEDSNHKSEQYFCDECDVNFDKSTAYARHLYAHTFIKKEDDDMPCICTTCGQDFPDRIELNKHIPSSPRCSGISKFLFPCYYCEKIFTRKDNLRDDLRCHINVERRKMLHKRDYNCHKCSKQYGGQTILTIHLLSHKGKSAKTKAESTNPVPKSKRKKVEKLVAVKNEPI